MPKTGKTKLFGPGFGRLFAENQFSPCETLIHLVSEDKLCHFDVVACSKARRVSQTPKMAQRSLADLDNFNSNSNLLFVFLDFNVRLRFVVVQAGDRVTFN